MHLKLSCQDIEILLQSLFGGFIRFFIFAFLFVFPWSRASSLGGERGMWGGGGERAGFGGGGGEWPERI